MAKDSTTSSKADGLEKTQRILLKGRYIYLVMWSGSIRGLALTFDSARDAISPFFHWTK